MSLEYFWETKEKLEIIADDYENPERALEKLSHFKNAPRSPEDIEIFIQGVYNVLFGRDAGEERFFPGVSIRDLRKHLGIHLRRIFEKSPNKLILLGEVKEKMVGIHPLLTYLYDNLWGEFKGEGDHYLRKLKVEVINAPISLGFEGVEAYLPVSLLNEPWKLYLVLNKKDASYLGLNFEGNKLITNYKIREHLDGSISIEILKPEKKREKLSVTMQLPELFSEIREDCKELRILIGSDLESYAKVKLKREDLIRKLEEVHLEKEDFYEELIKARIADQFIPPDTPLAKIDTKEYKVRYEVALMGLEDYIEKREKAIKEKREEIMKRLMRE